VTRACGNGELGNTAVTAVRSILFGNGKIFALFFLAYYHGDGKQKVCYSTPFTIFFGHRKRGGWSAL